MVNDGVDHGVDHDAQKRTSESYDAPHHIRLTKSACSLPTEGVEVGEGEEDTPPGQWLAMHRQLLHVGHVRAEARVTSMQEIMDLDVRAPAGVLLLLLRWWWWCFFVFGGGGVVV